MNGRGAIGLAAALLSLAVLIGGFDWKASADLDIRSRELGLQSAQLAVRDNDVLAKERAAATAAASANQTAAELETRRTQLNTVASDLNARANSLSAAQRDFDAQLALYSGAGNCTVWVGGHDANVQMQGPGAGSACTTVESWMQSRSLTTRYADASDAGAVCHGSKGSVIFTVRDTGGLFYGTRICDALIRWSSGTDLSTIATSFR